MTVRKIPEIKKENTDDFKGKGYDGRIRTLLITGSTRDGKVKESLDFFRSEFDKVIEENKYEAERQAIDERYRAIQSVAIRLMDKGMTEIAINSLKWIKWQYEAGVKTERKESYSETAGFNPYTSVIPNRVGLSVDLAEQLLKMSFEELKKLNNLIKSLEDSGNDYIARKIMSTLHFYSIRENLVEAISMLTPEELTTIYDRRKYKEYGHLIDIQGYYEDLITRIGMPEEGRENMEILRERARWANMFTLNLLRLSKISKNLYDDDIFSWAYSTIKDALDIDYGSNHQQAYNVLKIAQKAVRYIEESSEQTIETDKKIIISQLHWLSNKIKDTPSGSDREVEEALKQLHGNNATFKAAIVGVWVCINLMNIDRLGYLED